MAMLPVIAELIDGELAGSEEHHITLQQAPRLRAALKGPLLDC